MDMPPAIEYQMPSDEQSIQDNGIQTNTFDLYKYYVLDRIDGPDIPENVKQFAKEHNCIKIMKKYYWSSQLFNNEGGVYVCGINGKAQYIFHYNHKLRFAHLWEKIKIQRTPVYEN